MTELNFKSNFFYLLPMLIRPLKIVFVSILYYRIVLKCCGIRGGLSICLYIDGIKTKDDILYCYTKDSIKGLPGIGQMLVDSDNYTFTYTLGDGKAYAYLIFAQETWTMLHENVIKEIIINDELELIKFHQELTYVLDNIKGSNNRDKGFIAIVEETFDIE